MRWGHLGGEGWRRWRTRGEDGVGGGRGTTETGGGKEKGGAGLVRLGEQGNGQGPRLGETFGCEPSRTELRRLGCRSKRGRRIWSSSWRAGSPTQTRLAK